MSIMTAPPPHDPLTGLRRSLESSLADLGRAQEQINAQRLEVQARTEALRARQLEGWSSQRRVQAVVNGEGLLQDLRIEPGSLRTSHPGQLGTEIAEAVRTARAAASEENRKAFHDLMPGIFPAEPTTEGQL